jgi:hypothetical protein
MDTEQEIWRLAGEAIAVQNILVGVCMGLAQSGEAGDFIVKTAFSYAETVAAAGAMKLGKASNQTHLAAQMGVIEQLRKGVFGDSDSPKASV